MTRTAPSRRNSVERDNGGAAPLRVTVAEDNRLVAAGIRTALEQDDEIEIVGEVHSGADVMRAVAEQTPDVLLLDVRLPVVGGLECLERVRERYPDVKVVMLATAADAEQTRIALARGAAGYIVTTIDPRDVAPALRQAMDQSVYHTIAAPTAPTPRAAHEAGLTDREVTILRGVARGLSNQAIARELWVTEQTVKFHLTNIFRKLGVSNRTEAARYAFLHDLVDDEGGPGD